MKPVRVMKLVEIMKSVRMMKPAKIMLSTENIESVESLKSVDSIRCIILSGFEVKGTRFENRKDRLYRVLPDLDIFGSEAFMKNREGQTNYTLRVDPTKSGLNLYLSTAISISCIDFGRSCPTLR